MDRIEMIKIYFASWLKKERTQFDQIFSEDVVYSECYGPEYHGLVQVKQWFDDWNEHGTVLEWTMKDIIQEQEKFAVEWYFRCDYDHNVDGFDGVTIVEFNAQDQICFIKEFQSKAEHYYPYD